MNRFRFIDVGDSKPENNPIDWTKVRRHRLGESIDIFYIDENNKSYVGTIRKIGEKWQMATVECTRPKYKTQQEAIEDLIRRKKCS